METNRSPFKPNGAPEKKLVNNGSQPNSVQKPCTPATTHSKTIEIARNPFKNNGNPKKKPFKNNGNRQKPFKNNCDQWKNNSKTMRSSKLVENKENQYISKPHEVKVEKITSSY